MGRPNHKAIAKNVHFTLVLPKFGHCVSCGGMTKNACWQCSRSPEQLDQDPVHLCDDDRCRKAHDSEVQEHG